MIIYWFNCRECEQCQPINNNNNAIKHNMKIEVDETANLLDLFAALCNTTHVLSLVVCAVVGCSRVVCFHISLLGTIRTVKIRKSVNFQINVSVT